MIFSIPFTAHLPVLEPDPRHPVSLHDDLGHLGPGADRAPVFLVAPAQLPYESIRIAGGGVGQVYAPHGAFPEGKRMRANCTTERSNLFRPSAGVRCFSWYRSSVRE